MREVKVCSVFPIYIPISNFVVILDMHRQQSIPVNNPIPSPKVKVCANIPVYMMKPAVFVISTRL